ncbi:hypothetical protein [Streptomyces pseudovenezuelae]|uniref:hypothetical protein n=1 Tax=Streptomyces pseudovenezuelae TaxID=67350 RepID=UPI002E80726B|nr:hypothetical protein [Streptomyces pseudovenezuelae]WUA93853.1 hypothetical protein OHO81_43855 [Streptomyces pseudovenezuelae]
MCRPSPPDWRTVNQSLGGTHRGDLVLLALGEVEGGSLLGGQAQGDAKLPSSRSSTYVESWIKPRNV